MILPECIVTSTMANVITKNCVFIFPDFTVRFHYFDSRRYYECSFANNVKHRDTQDIYKPREKFYPYLNKYLQSISLHWWHAINSREKKSSIANSCFPICVPVSLLLFFSSSLSPFCRSIFDLSSDSKKEKFAYRGNIFADKSAKIARMIRIS